MSSNQNNNSHCHVFIMQHGLHGTDADFVFLEQELLAKIPAWTALRQQQNSEQQQENDVESSTSTTSTSTSTSNRNNHNRNVFTLRIKATNGRTHDGIEILGRLNALEVLDYMVNHQKLHQKFETIFVSFIGHSLGGLINRNAIAWLFHEHKTHCLYNMSGSGSGASSGASSGGSGSGSGCGGAYSSEIFQLFSPVRNRCHLTSFLTLTSPHLGSRRPGGTLFQSIWRRGVHTFLGSAVGKTGLELSLNDQIPMLVFPAAAAAAMDNSTLSVPDSTTTTGSNEQQANGTMIDFTNCNNTGSNGNEELGGEKDTSSTTSTSSNSGHHSSRRHSRTRSNSGHGSGHSQQQTTPTMLLNVKQQQQQQQQSLFTFGGSNASQLSSLLYLNHSSILPPSPSSSSKRERRKSFLASSGSSNSSSGSNIGGSDQSIMVTREKRKRRKSGFQAWRSQTMNLLDIMSQPHGVYMQVLQMFRFRTALAISHFDLSVPYSSASIRSFNPHAVPKFVKRPRFHIVGYSGFENEQYEKELLAPRMLQLDDETMSSVSSVSSVASLSNMCNAHDDNDNGGGNVVAVGGDVGDQSMTPMPTAVETTTTVAATEAVVESGNSEDRERIITTTESVSSVSTNATQQTNGKQSQLAMDESIPMIEVPNGTTISTMTSVDDEDDNDDDCGAGSEREHKHIGVRVELEVSEQQQQQQEQQNQTETTTTETVTTTIRRHLSFGELKGTEHEPFEGDDNMNGYFADNARQVEFSTQMLSNLQNVTWRRVDVEFTLQNTLQKHMVHIMPVRKSRSYPVPGGDLLDKVAAECITFEAQMLWMDHEIALREQQQQDK